MRLERDQLLSFLPAPVADEVLAGGCEALLPRRLEATVLSCDVSAFRPLAERDPERSIRFLNAFLERAAAAVLGESGTLMSFPGDGLLAVFGAPLERQDHRAAAERAGDGIREALPAAARAELEPGEIDALGIDIAVESGTVLGAAIGAGPRWEYAAIGAPTSRAVARTGG